MKTRLRLLAPTTLLGLVVATVTFFSSSVPVPSRAPLVARFTGPTEAIALLRRRIISPDFDPVLGLRPNSRLIEASGPFACDPGERWRVEIIIEQGDALAIGRTQGKCSGELGTWHVLAAARGRASFASGSAEGCGTIETIARGQVTDTFQWCGEFLLETPE